MVPKQYQIESKLGVKNILNNESSRITQKLHCKPQIALFPNLNPKCWPLFRVWIQYYNPGVRSLAHETDIILKILKHTNLKPGKYNTMNKN